jgi:cytochrome c biogenesis protein CcmG/thiol:disulfide interchange protein DsbE
MIVRAKSSEGLFSRERADVIAEVLMARDRRFRVRAEREGMPIAEIAGDGRSVKEWSADRGEWTEYDASHDPPLLIVDRAGKPRVLPAVAPYAKNWLGDESPFCDRLRDVLSGHECRISTSEIEGRACDVIEIKDSQTRGAMSLSMKGTLAFDAEEHLPVLEEEVMSISAALIPVTRASTTRLYEQIELDPELPDSAFVFRPPQESQFVSLSALLAKGGPQVGQRAPNVAFTTLDGSGDIQAPLREFCQHGPVLLVFWATWCLPCKQEFSDLEELLGEKPHENLTVLAVSADKSKRAAESFVKRNPLPFTVLWDGQGARAQFGAGGVPATFLIDSEGVVRGRWNGWSSGRESEKKLAEIRNLLQRLR